MKQRWEENSKPSGLLNITINDIIFNTSGKVKHNILKACNECSYDDLYTFVSHASLRASIVTVGEIAYLMEKLELSEFSWESIEQEFIEQFPGEDHFMTGYEWDINKLADFWATVLREFRIDLRRWA